MKTTKQMLDLGTVELARIDHGVVKYEVEPGVPEMVHRVEIVATLDGDSHASSMFVKESLATPELMAKEELVFRQCVVQSAVEYKLKKVGWL